VRRAFMSVMLEVRRDKYMDEGSGALHGVLSV